MRTVATGDLLAVYDRPYGSFTDETGKRVEGGFTHWGVLFVGADAEPVTFKIRRDSKESVRGHVGKRVTVELRPFAKGNRVEWQFDTIALAAKAAS